MSCDPSFSKMLSIAFELQYESNKLLMSPKEQQMFSKIFHEFPNTSSPARTRALKQRFHFSGQTVIQTLQKEVQCLQSSERDVNRLSESLEQQIQSRLEREQSEQGRREESIPPFHSAEKKHQQTSKHNKLHFSKYDYSNLGGAVGELNSSSFASSFLIYSSMSSLQQLTSEKLQIQLIDPTRSQTHNSHSNQNANKEKTFEYKQSNNMLSQHVCLQQLMSIPLNWQQLSQQHLAQSPMAQTQQIQTLYFVDKKSEKIAVESVEKTINQTKAASVQQNDTQKNHKKHKECEKQIQQQNYHFSQQAHESILLNTFDFQLGSHHSECSEDHGIDNDDNDNDDDDEYEYL